MAPVTCFLLLAFCYLASGRYVDVESTPMKRSAPSDFDFASALNGAQRLRYGKRGFDPSVIDNVITLNEVGKRGGGAGGAGFADAQLYDNLIHYMEAGKRSSSLSQLAQSLNGAERLRYG